MARKVVRFLAGHSPYQAGETAGFPTDEAEAYVRAGVSVPVGWELDATVVVEDDDDTPTLESIADMHHVTARKLIDELDDIELLEAIVEHDGRASVVQVASERLAELVSDDDNGEVGDGDGGETTDGEGDETTESEVEETGPGGTDEGSEPSTT